MPTPRAAGATAAELATAREVLGEVPLLRAALASAELERDVLLQRLAAAAATRQSDGAAAGEAGEREARVRRHLSATLGDSRRVSG